MDISPLDLFSKVFLKKFNLVAHALLKVVPKVDIKMADGIMDHLRLFSQYLPGLFSEAHENQGVLIAYLQQDRTTHVLGILIKGSNLLLTLA